MDRHGPNGAAPPAPGCFDPAVSTASSRTIYTIISVWSQKGRLCRGIILRMDGEQNTSRTMAGTVSSEASTRVDMHCHSTASQLSRLGVQRALGLPECATPPQEAYELAKRRGMDFVTITDHDTIAGVLEIAELPDVFISEELTAHFRGEAQAVHVLCYGISGEDHEWLQAHRGDVEICAAYLYEREIVCALAHPYYTVNAPLTAAPPTPPGPAVRRLGGPQRRPRPRAEPARGNLRRHARHDRHRRLRRPCGYRHRAHVDRGPAGEHAGGVPRARAWRRGRCRRSPGERGQVGARRDRARGQVAGPRRRGRGRQGPGSPHRARDGAAAAARGRRARGGGERRARPRPKTPAASCGRG